MVANHRRPSRGLMRQASHRRNPPPDGGNSAPERPPPPPCCGCCGCGRSLGGATAVRQRQLASFPYGLGSGGGEDAGAGGPRTEGHGLEGVPEPTVHLTTISNEGGEGADRPRHCVALPRLVASHDRGWLQFRVSPFRPGNLGPGIASSGILQDQPHFCAKRGDGQQGVPSGACVVQIPALRHARCLGTSLASPGLETAVDWRASRRKLCVFTLDDRHRAVDAASSQPRFPVLTILPPRSVVHVFSGGPPKQRFRPGTRERRPCANGIGASEACYYPSLR